MRRKELEKMYNNNSYISNMQYNPQPYASYGYNGYGYQPQAQNQIQKPVQQQDFPFSVVRFGTLDEAKGHIVAPSRAIMFIKSDFSEIYVKSADAMGNPALETFKCSRIDENPTLPVSPVLDPKDFVKMEDLKDFVKSEDIKELPTKQEMENFAKKMHSMEDEIKKLNRLTELIGGKDNGK